MCSTPPGSVSNDAKEEPVVAQRFSQAVEVVIQLRRETCLADASPL